MRMCERHKYNVHLFNGLFPLENTAPMCIYVSLDRNMEADTEAQAS